MNYLELCQRLRIEAGISGTGPSTVTGQTGDMLRVVNWITAAYNDIQIKHSTWRFLRRDFSFQTSIANQEYTPAAANITDFSKWIEENMTLYLNVQDEFELIYIPWDDFRILYMRGPYRTAQERPTFMTIRPSNEALVLWHIPDNVYTVTGEYYKIPDIMTADEDVPVFPAKFHMAAVWKGLMYYGAYIAADEKYAHGKEEYDKIMRKLQFEQLAELTHGEPLA